VPSLPDAMLAGVCGGVVQMTEIFARALVDGALVLLLPTSPSSPWACWPSDVRVAATHDAPYDGFPTMTSTSSVGSHSVSNLAGNDTLNLLAHHDMRRKSWRAASSHHIFPSYYPISLADAQPTLVTFLETTIAHGSADMPHPLDTSLTSP
jgi:hypothetical protein